MKRYLAGAAVAGCILAVWTGTAAATASFDINSQSGFIGRGDVIAAAGKDALIANPVVRFLKTTSTRLVCTWPDSTQRTTTISQTLVIVYNAETRYAPGSGIITGYVFGRSDEIISSIDPPFLDPTAACWSALGIAPNGATVQIDAQPLPSTSTLTFFGPSGPFDLPL